MSLSHRIVIAVALCAAAALATSCNQDGSSYSYTESVTTTANTRTIVTNYCPNHPSYNTNPNYAVAGTQTITIPLYPKLLGTAVTKSPSGGNMGASLTAKGGSVGVFFSGAQLYSPYAGATAGTASGHSTSATALEGNTFDQCGGHSSSTTAASYHMHVPPACLMNQLGGGTISETVHSPQIGWAADGFPIYGPRGKGGTMMQTCTVTGGTYGTAQCTDDCGGYYKSDTAIDTYTYRYHIQGTYPDGTTCTSGACPSPKALYYPNTPTCFRGCCPAGVTCSYGTSVVPACSSSTKTNGYSSLTPSTTTSNGQGGSGSDVATGLAQNTGGCACASLGCETTTCSDQGWDSTTCQAFTNSCPAISNAMTPNSAFPLLSVFAVGAAAFANFRA